MGQDLCVGLLHLPPVRKTVLAMPILGCAVLIGAIPGIVVLDKGNGPVLPWVTIGVVPNQTNALSKPVPWTITALVVLQCKKRGEVEYVTGRREITRRCCCKPNPPTLLILLVPIVFADGKGGFGGP